MPRELELLRHIDRFGLGVLGRTPGAGELRRLLQAEAVVKAYYERNRSENWAAWAGQNPYKAWLLDTGARMQDEQ